MDNTTPSPTLEESAVTNAQIIPNKDGNSISSFASVKSDLMEAANAVAQALGARILDGGESPSNTRPIFSKKEETCNLNHGFLYKWNDWRLLRTKDTLFLWCDAVAIEFR